MKRRSVFAIAAGVMLTASVAFGQTPAPAAPAAAAPAAKPAAKKVLAKFVTSEGNFTAELFEADAPKTVANFIGLATGSKQWTDPKSGAMKTKTPFYNGLTFHRVIANFMIQGGDPLGNGTGGPGYKFGDEFQSGRRLNKAGLLAMANAGPGTNGSQFFITLRDTDYLTGKHTVFGEIVEGMDVVNKIGAVKTTKPGDKPVTPVVIKSVTIERP
jgi:peptidyl-prolyl cis-trans isomerase A (cyclophilin A)